MAELDVAIVTYHPDRALFQQLVASLAQATREPLRVNLLVQDNGGDDAALDGIRRIAAEASGPSRSTVRNCAPGCGPPCADRR